MWANKEENKNDSGIDASKYALSSFVVTIMFRRMLKHPKTVIDATEPKSIT